jgi:hypothetical protein
MRSGSAAARERIVAFDRPGKPSRAALFRTGRAGLPIGQTLCFAGGCNAF